MGEYVLVLNCGSSSVKFSVVDPSNGAEPLKGLAERLGQEQAEITIKGDNIKQNFILPEATHQSALKSVVNALHEAGLAEQIKAIGHRIVQGGKYFSASVLVDDDVRNKIEECASLAPLHNHAHVMGIDAAREAFSHLKQVVVFDSAFHQRMPQKAYLYALPYEYYEKYSIRKYGFHGTSYRYIAMQLPQILGIERPKAIVCHLGNGGSLAAIDFDHSKDTTMGLTPLEGLVHGTRSGDIDPAIVTILNTQFGLPVKEIDDVLWKRSGLLGLSQLSNDCRSLQEAMAEGHEGAKRALEIYAYRLAKHIASQMVAINGADALVFTGGIGENSAYIRKETVSLLQFMGLEIDDEKNNATYGGKQGHIEKEGSKPILVVPTNEELLIARDTIALTS